VGGVHGSILHWLRKRISTLNILELGSTKIAESFVADKILYAVLPEPPLDVRCCQVPDQILGKLPGVWVTLPGCRVPLFLKIETNSVFNKITKQYQLLKLMIASQHSFSADPDIAFSLNVDLSLGLT